MVVETWQRILTWFWDPAFWLPNHLKWKDIRPSEDFQYPNHYDALLYPLIGGVILLFVRYKLNSLYIFGPLAKLVGISDKRPHPPIQNNILETVYLRHQLHPPHGELKMVASRLSWSERQASNWLRRRAAVSQETKFEKFCDCGFECSLHLLVCLQGCCTMMDKPWVWDLTLCWYDYPHHPIDATTWCYYMAGLTLYYTLTFIQIMQKGRKDKYEMILHHIVTIILMTFSWASNFVRIGVMVLLVHEFADIPLMAAKMCRYSAYNRFKDYFFVVFILTWLITRLYLYPFIIMQSVLFESPRHVDMPALFFFEALLIGLVILNVIWSVMIIKILAKRLVAGELEDCRSSSEEFISDEGETNSKKLN